MDGFGADLSRRDIIKYGSTGAALLAGGSVLAACGGGSGDPTQAGGSSGGPALSRGPADEGTPVSGGQLIVGVISSGSSETIDPRKSIATPDDIRVRALYDTLFRQVPGGTEPGLAESAATNADATTWRLRLRDGVTFHDGKPFTADDVLYTIRSSWASKGSSLAGATEALIDIRNLRKIDRLTVEVPLRRPFNALEAFASFQSAAIIPDGMTDFSKPVGTGAYTFGSFNPGTRSEFPANPDYWRGAPHVDALIVDSSFTDDAARVNALVGGQIHIAPYVPPALAKANESSGRVVLGNAEGFLFIPVVMRVNVPPFDDERVVQAFKLAIDRDAIVESVYSGYATIGNDSPGATLEYWAEDIKPEYDPEKARALLKAAGQSNLSVPLMSAPALPGMDETATLVSGQLKAIGVDAPLNRTPVSSYFTSATPAYASDQRLLYTSYWTTMAPSLGGFYFGAFTPGCQFNETGWGNRKESQDLINAALAETDPAKAKQRWHDAQVEQVEKGGYIVPANLNNVDGYAPQVRGVQTTSAGSANAYDYSKAWLAS